MGFCNRYFPLGLAYLSSYLKVTGHEVGIYNSDFHPKPSKINYSLLPESYDLYLSALKDDAHPAFKEILDVIRGYKPDAVGITAMTPKMAFVFRISALVKKENPRIIL